MTDIDTEKVVTAIDRAVRPDGDRKPSFYAVTGSHIYGFPSEDSDIDVRGFHIAPGDRYLGLDEPKEQIIINQGGTTHGFEDYADIDLVSYELKKFGSLLYQGNFNVLELVFDGIEVMNGVPLEMNGLRRLVEDELPLDVPHHYVGMAKSNYHKYLKKDSGSYTPEAKKFLYVIRGLYGAEYVVEHGSIEPDVMKLADAVDGDTALVERLIDVKLESERAVVGNELANEAHEHIGEKFDELDPAGDVDKARYQQRLSDWMLKLRA